MTANRHPFPYLYFGIFTLISLVFLWFTRNNIFFWDSVQLVSKQAHWFYENGFDKILLPDNIDSGHPPLFGWYMALNWSVFGKSLAVSHFAILPFLLGIIYFGLRLASHFTEPKWSFLFLGFLFVLPYFESQVAVVSPDIALVCFFLGGLWSIYSNNNLLKIIAIALLGLVSMRGMMLGVALFIFEFIYYSDKEAKLFNRIKISIYPYLLASIPSIAFLLFHYASKGWIGFHDASPWAPLFETVGFVGFLKNIVLLIWRSLDFGGVFMLVFMGVAWAFFKKKHKMDIAYIKELIVLGLIVLAVLAINTIPYVGLMNHRYFLPVQLILCMIAGVYARYMFNFDPRYVLVLLFLWFKIITGSFWPYPSFIDKGWDVTLAHWPYYSQHSELLQYIEDNDIDRSLIGTEFPNRTKLKYLNLSDDEFAFEKADLNKHQYIWESTAMNDFTDEQLEALENEWEMVHEIWSLYHSTKLYKKK